jgi:cobaltochelatase CobS
MEQNEVIKQVIETIRRDIVSDKNFLKEIFDGFKLSPQQIPAETILTVMSTLNQTRQIKKPVSNRPKDMEGTDAAKPNVFTGTAQFIATKVVSDLLEGNNVYLTGKAGTGKTYMAEKIAKDIMGQPNYTINCSQWTSPIEIRGGQTIRGYEEGLLIKAWANGGILILDELPKLDPNTAGLLNAALAKTADQPQYDENGKIIPDTIPYIVNGKGEKIYKGTGYPDPVKPSDIASSKVPEDIRFRFGVIGTGNTDMMNVGNKYGGNQRQDYSLVDRFAGSFYTIENDPVLEQSLTYPYVFNIANTIRKFLETQADAAQSISLRTMLNFNRTYEQQMLNVIESKAFADEIFDADGYRVPPKTLQDSIQSFMSMMQKELREKLLKDKDFMVYYSNNALTERAFTLAEQNFKDEFKKKYHLNPMDGKPLTDEEISKLNSK